VIGAVPIEVRVTDWVAVVFSVTLPNERLGELTLSAGTTAFNCTANLWVALPAFAVIVADWAVLTDDMVAVNAALLVLAGTTTDAGTLTALLLLERLTLNPLPDAAALSVTVQESVPEPVIDAVPHDRAVKDAGAAVPLPVRLTAVFGLAVELLEKISCPATDPAAVGANWTARLVLWPGLSVVGKLAPDAEKPAPLAVTELIVTGAVPVEVRVTDWVAAVFTVTLPNERAGELTPKAADGAFSSREKLMVTVPALADRATAWVEVTAPTVAEKLPELEPEGIVNEAGTEAAALLLWRLRLNPPVGAALVSVTVHTSVPAPVIAELWHESALRAAVGVPLAALIPLPCNFTQTGTIAGVLAMTLSWPAESVSELGLYWTFTLSVLPAAMVTGRFPWPLMENESLVRLNWETWTGKEPGFEIATTWSAEAPMFTSPNSTVAGVAANEDTAPFTATPPHPDRASETATASNSAKYEKLRAKWLWLDLLESPDRSE
jgi:hypothetical protein